MKNRNVQDMDEYIQSQIQKRKEENKVLKKLLAELEGNKNQVKPSKKNS